MQDKTRGILEMTGAMLISGTIGAFVVGSGQPVLHVVFWRCVFGFIALLAVCAAMGLFRPGMLTRRQLVIAVLGGVAIVLNWLLLFAAYGHASIAVATAVYNTQPFMLVGLGVVFLGERLTAARLAWLGIAFGGVLLVLQGRPGSAAPGGDYLVGIALALGAAFFYALAALAAKALRGVKPHLIALIHVAVGIVMLAPFGALSALPTGSESWSILLTLGLVHTGAMYILLYGALQRLPTPVAGALSFLYPLMALAVDIVWFGREFGAVQLAGMATILFGAAGMTLGWTSLRVAGRRAV
ncbi:MAG: DMT family transporter [Ferrovibrio sp.]